MKVEWSCFLISGVQYIRAWQKQETKEIKVKKNKKRTKEKRPKGKSSKLIWTKKAGYGTREN